MGMIAVSQRELGPIEIIEHFNERQISAGGAELVWQQSTAIDASGLAVQSRR